MAYNYFNVDTVRRQLHSRSVSFNNFKEITEEDIKRIKKKIESLKTFSVPKYSYVSKESDNYASTLRYLTNPRISTEYKTIEKAYEINIEFDYDNIKNINYILKDIIVKKTFDEKILHLILATDPDFITFKTFLASNITPIEDINDEQDEKRRRQLQDQRRLEIETFEKEVRKQIGFYDGNLIKYERILTMTLFKTEGFISDVKTSSINPLLKRAELVKNINVITELNLKRLKLVAERWATMAKDPQDLNSLAYNLLNKYKDMHIHTIEEQIILFILIADPELDLLRIFEEESTYQKMQERAQEEKGFYNKGLINVERLYHDKFEPEKVISAWTK